MARNLIELIRASGGAGTSGQSFRSNVDNAPLPDGVKMTDYLLNGITFSGSIPVIDIPEGYSSSELFNCVAHFQSGNGFELIQRDEAQAWLFSIVGGLQASATLETWSSNGAGVSHNLGVRVLGAVTGNPTGGWNAVSNDVGGSNPWTVTWTANPGNLGGTGQTQLDIIIQYDPDYADFNIPILYDLPPNSWRGDFDNRGYNASTDFDYQWRTGATGGGQQITSARSFTLVNDFGWDPGGGQIGTVYPTAWEFFDTPYPNNGLIPGEASQPIYLRWRLKVSSGGNGTWNDMGPLIHTDPRFAE